MSGNRIQRLRRVFSRLRRDESGQGLVEYGLIITIVSLGAVISLGFFSGKIQGLYSKITSGLNEQAAPGSPSPGTFGLPTNNGNFCDNALFNGRTIHFTYYPENTVYGPGDASDPRGYRGIYVIGDSSNPSTDAGILFLYNAASTLNQIFTGQPCAPLPTNGISTDGYDLPGCIWSVGVWHPVANPTNQFGYACRVVPGPPIPGVVSLAPGGPVITGTALVATTSGWSNNPETFRYTWQRSSASGSLADDCSNAANYGTWQTNNNQTATTNSETPSSQSDGNRCYRVVVHATNPQGSNAPPDPVSNAVHVTLPPPPAGGTVTLAPPGPTQLGQTLTATTGGWSNTPTDYTFTWQRTGQSGSWTAATCSAAASNQFGTFQTSGTNAPDVDTTYSTNNSSNGNRCYRVIVEATNAGGDSNPDATSNVVLMQNPPPPAGGTVTLAPPGPIQLGQTLTATTGGWSNTPTDYTFTWQRTNQSGSWTAATCSAAASNQFGTFQTSGTNAPDVDTTYSTNNTSNGNRCYRVIVEATNQGGDSNPDATSNVVLMQNPPPPSGGTVTLAPPGPIQLGQTLTATTGGWSNSPTSYTFDWQRTGQSVSWTAATCSAAASNQFSTFMTSNTNAPDVDTTYTTNTASNSNRCYRVIVEATNAAGDSNPDATSNVVLMQGDVTAPLVTITAPAEGATGVNRCPSYSGARGQASGDNSQVTVTVRRTSDNALAYTNSTSNGGATWTINQSNNRLSSNTQYTATVTQTDATGNIGTDSNTFTTGLSASC